MSEEIKKMIDEQIKNNVQELSENSFIIFNEKGESKVFYKLLEFDDQETQKRYRAYTAYEKDENGSNIVYGSEIQEENGYTKLQSITSEKVWKVIETTLRTIDESGKNNEEVTIRLQQVNIELATETQKMKEIENNIERFQKKISLLNGEKEKIEESLVESKKKRGETAPD